jgi:Carboxypeptidase regulatory-like domain/TonB dependent receptor
MYKVRSYKYLVRLGAFVLLLSYVNTLPLLAQQYLGTLTGEVSDASGAKIANAEVAATDVTTHFTTRTKTNGSGEYSIPFLTPDTYDVTITISGFRPETRTGVVLTAGANERTDFSLQVGTVGEKVVVTADLELLDTASANLGTTLGTKEVTDLPNVGRNPFVLSTLAAGVTTGAYMQSKSSGFTNPFSGVAVQIIANGSSGHNRLTLDGIPDDPAERLSGASYTGFVPSPEAVQEVKTQTALYDAQYGHGNGTVLNSVLRAGSNRYHGSAYYVFRNTYLDANTHERVPTQNAAVSPTHRVNDQWAQPGGVIDGPVVIPHLYNGHDKTFFMAAYEYIQLHQPVPFSGLVPTKAQLAGDFSGLCSNFIAGVCAAGAGVQLYDPLTADANGNRTPFLNNNIASRINTAGAALATYYPAPNSTLSPTVNYISSDTSSPNKYWSFVTRVDHSFSDRNKLNATFFKAVLHQIQPHEGFPKQIAPTGIGYTVYRNNIGGSLDDVTVISPTLVVDARIGVIYHPFGLVYPGSTFDLSTININGSGLPNPSFPGTAFTDSYSGLAAGNTGQISEDTLGSASVLVSKTLSKHTLRVGFDGNLSRYNVQNPQSGVGIFNFDRRFTQKNSVSTAVGSDANSGNPFASLLLGYPSSGTYGNQIAYALQQLYYGIYVQDDWRVMRNLTVNAGLRWDYESPFTERYDRQNVGFCATCPNPLQASVTGLTLNGGLQFATSSHRNPYPSDWNNFQPRFGVEYQLNPNVVLRGGFGVIYFNTLESPLGQGYSSSTSYVATLDSTHPANILSNPFPTGINLPTGSALGLATQVGQGITAPDSNHTQPKIMQYSVSVQTQLPANMVLQIAYVGNKASQLEINKSIDALPAQYFNQGASGVTFLQTQVANPMAGLLPGSSLNSATVQRQFLLTPFPEFTNVTDNYASKGSVLYNSLQTSVVKRVSHGLTIQGNFTWSKIMDQNIYLNAQDSLDSPFRYQDPNPNLVGNLVGIYQFSSLSGKRAIERWTLGGWQVNGVLRAQNGNLVANPGGSNGSAGTVTPLSTAHLGNATYGRYFNTCYENAAGALVMTTPTAPGCDSTASVPAFQQHLSFTLNNIGPYMNDVRQRVHPLMDLSLFKRFQLHESLNFEIRGEFFNVLNTPNFGGPGTTPGSASYGIVTLTQLNDPRLTQLTARLNF